MQEIIEMKPLTDTIYRAETGESLTREKAVDKGGNHHPSIWVYRDASGRIIDMDQYRNDLAGRYKLRLL